MHWPATGGNSGATMAGHRFRNPEFTRISVPGANAQGWVEVQDPQKSEASAYNDASVTDRSIESTSRGTGQESSAVWKGLKTDFDLIIALPDGSPWKPDSFTAAYARYAAKIGLKGIRFHDLRHSRASHRLRQRVPLKTVQQRLGHANASITLNTYAHMLPGDDEEAAELIDKRLRGYKEAVGKWTE